MENQSLGDIDIKPYLPLERKERGGGKKIYPAPKTEELKRWKYIRLFFKTHHFSEFQENANGAAMCSFFVFFSFKNASFLKI